jgi:eukaryotic-like serine/threonine-protein kinase
MPASITVIKHYQIQAPLGEGGFGQVFEAWDTKLLRRVAIKRLKNTGSQNNDLLREARLAASLQHSAFVKIHALEDDDDSQSIVMELVEGQTLKKLLALAKPDRAQAINILRQLAEAMQQAHAAGLTHGDLKPSNIMVEPSGTARILDFGLARKVDTQTTLSVLQQNTQGTIAYMAPERLLGATLAPQADIYALGVILYELVTGARPFAELSGFALAAAQMQSSSDLWDYAADIPAALSQLIRNMTAKLPAQRLASMSDVLFALDEMENPTAVTINTFNSTKINSQRNTILPINFWKKIKINRTPIITTSALACAVFVGWFAQPYMNNVEKIVTPFSESQAMNKGMAALEQWDRPGSLDEAIQHFSNLAERNTENAAAIAGLSIAYSLRYEWDTQDEIWLQKSVASAQQAIKLNPHLALSDVAMGRVLLEQGKPVMALENIERAIKLDPLNVFAWYGKIDIFEKLARHEDALKLAKDGLQKFPQNRTFANEIGAIYAEQGKYDEAEQAFRQSISIQPDSVYAYVNLSAILQYKGKTEEALHLLQQGLQIRPSAWLYTNLGNIYFFKGEYIDAVVAFEAALSPVLGNANDYLDWANLADTLQWIPGRKQEAKKYYAKARELLTPILKRRPDDLKLASRMALYSARLGDKEQCKTLLAPLLYNKSNLPELHFRGSLAYELIGERILALEQITIAHKLGYPLNMIEAEPDLEPLRRDPQYTLR